MHNSAYQFVQDPGSVSHCPPRPLTPGGTESFCLAHFPQGASPTLATILRAAEHPLEWGKGVQAGSWVCFAGCSLRLPGAACVAGVWLARVELLGQGLGWGGQRPDGQGAVPRPFPSSASNRGEPSWQPLPVSEKRGWWQASRYRGKSEIGPGMSRCHNCLANPILLASLAKATRRMKGKTKMNQYHSSHWDQLCVGLC